MTTNNTDELIAHTVSISYTNVSGIPIAIKTAYKKFLEVSPNENCWSCPSPSEKSIRTRRFNALYTLCDEMGMNAPKTIALLGMSDPAQWKA